MPEGEQTDDTTERDDGQSVQLTEDELRKLAEIVFHMLATEVRIERERLGR